MPTEFRLPELGENITEAEIAEILVKEGDRIEAEQPVLELETEKAVVELPCPHAGVVVKVHVAEGATVAVGAIVLTIDDADGGTVIATDEESVEPPSVEEAAKPDAAEDLPTPVVSSTAPAAAQAKPTPTESRPGDRPPPAAGPSTRHMARRLGVDLHDVTGTAEGGRITHEDVEAYVSNRLKSAPSTGVVAAEPLPDFTQFGPVERKKLSKLNRTAADQLSRSWNSIPHVTQHELADVTELDSVRRKYMQSVGKDGPKITVTAVVLKACVQLLAESPEFNSSLDSETGELVLKQYYHVGVAVDTEHGLVVPVIRDADEKSILEIAAELTELATRARERKLKLADMQGASFTITNLGGIGGTAFTPIVNHPEVAILGLSRSRMQPAYIDGELQERLMLPLSLSYDHRVVNGADAARFVVKLSALLAQPFGLLANV